MDPASAATLPIEIITIILSYLPVISLLRFKCVCRSWYELINSPTFIDYHMSQSLSSNSNRMLVVAASNTNFYSLNFDSPDSPCAKLPLPQGYEGRSLEIGGSCNGVFCLYSLNSNSDIILFNPSTKMYKVIPVIGSTIYLGLGYHSRNSDYKLVRRFCLTEFVRTNFYKVSMYTMVYSLRNDFWNLCDESNSATKLMNCEPCGVLVNSHLLHWVPKNSHLVLRFDVCDETWSEMPLPQYDEGFGDSDPRCGLKLGNLDGCLCLFTKRYSDVNVWIMKEYGVMESWVKLANISDSIITQCLIDPPFAIGKQGGQILLVHAYHYGHSPRFFWYDSHNNTITIVATHGISSYEGALLCSKTLASIIGGEQMEM